MLKLKTPSYVPLVMASRHFMDLTQNSFVDSSGSEKRNTRTGDDAQNLWLILSAWFQALILGSVHACLYGHTVSYCNWLRLLSLQYITG